MFLQNKQPCTKPVSSELFFAADPRPKLRKRGNSEGTWSLLSDRGGTSTQKCILCKINEKLECANVPSILPL